MECFIFSLAMAIYFSIKKEKSHLILSLLVFLYGTTYFAQAYIVDVQSTLYDVLSFVKILSIIIIGIYACKSFGEVS